MEPPVAAFLRALAVMALVAVVLALLPRFQPGCRPFGRRVSWFFVRYAFPYYCLTVGLRWLFVSLRHGGP